MKNGEYENTDKYFFVKKRGDSVSYDKRLIRPTEFCHQTIHGFSKMLGFFSKNIVSEIADYQIRVLGTSLTYLCVLSIKQYLEKKKILKAKIGPSKNMTKDETQ